MTGEESIKLEHVNNKIYLAIIATLTRCSCATALYYYDSENIVESMLALRQRVQNVSMLHYEQHSFRALKIIYEIKNDSAYIQNMRTIVTKIIFDLIDSFMIETDNVSRKIDY